MANERTGKRFEALIPVALIAAFLVFQGLVFIPPMFGGPGAKAWFDFFVMAGLTWVIYKLLCVFFPNKKDNVRFATAPQMSHALYLLYLNISVTFFAQEKFYQQFCNPLNIEIALEAVIFSVLVGWFLIRPTLRITVVLLLWQVGFVIANTASIYFIIRDGNLPMVKIILPFLIFRLIGIAFLLGVIRTSPESGAPRVD